MAEREIVEFEDPDGGEPWRFYRNEFDAFIAESRRCPAIHCADGTVVWPLSRVDDLGRIKAWAETGQWPPR